MMKFYTQLLVRIALAALIATSAIIAKAQTAIHDATITGPATDPDASAVLDAKSTNKGMLVPRVSLTGPNDATTVPTPATSLLVYNTSSSGGLSPGYYYNSGNSGSPVWIRLMSGNTPPLLVEVDPTFSNGGNQTNAIGRTGNITLTATSTSNGNIIFAGTAVRDALQLNNSNITNANHITIADPGVSEGITWTGSAGPWTLDVSPLGRTNADGNFNIYGTANNIALWRPTLFISNGTNYTTATPQASGGLHFTSTGNGHLTFSPGGTGNVGIGTTGPGAKLDVNGSALIRGTERVIKTAHAAGSNNYHLELYSDDTGDNTNEVSLRFHQGNRYYNQIRVRSGGFRFTQGNDDVLAAASMGNLTATGTVTFGTLASAGNRLVQANTSGVLSASGIDPATITTTANISGTTNYVAKFTAANSIGNSQIFDNGTSVGIGTASPSAKLHVNGGDIYLNDAANVAGYVLKSYSVGTSLWLLSGNTTDSKLVLSTSAHNWDRQVSISYVPGTTGSAAGVLTIGQVDKNNTNWTHGITRLLTNGSERMRIASNGNVGIGTTSPTSKLHVTDRVELSRMGLVGTYDSYQVQQIWSIGRGYNINTTDNDFGNSYGITYAHTNAGTTGAKKPISGWGHQILFTSNGTRNASISMSSGHAYFAGNLGVGTTAPTYKVHVNGAIRTNAINETSDARLKTEVTDLSDALGKVLAMRGVNYRWRIDEYPDMVLDSTLQFGLIAQELEQVVPELVKTDSEGWKSIEYSHIVPLLIEGMKEQQDIIGRQQKAIDDLRGMVMDMQRHTGYSRTSATAAEASLQE